MRDLHARGQWGQWKRLESSWVADDVFRLLSRASVISARLLSSKQSFVRLVVALHWFLSFAQGSRSFGAIPAILMSLLTQSLKRLTGLPCFRFPEQSSPYISCFGSLWSSILMTWPVHRSRL